MNDLVFNPRENLLTDDLVCKKQAAILCGLEALTAMCFSFLCTMPVGLKTLRSCLKQLKATKSVAWILMNFTPALRSSLLSLYAFSGCDSCSAFKGKRKVAPTKLLKKSVPFQEAFLKLGESQEVPSDVPGVLEEFMSAMYGNARVKCVNDTLNCWLSVVAKGELTESQEKL